MKTPTDSRQASLLSLFLVMLKIGLFTFGGGYAMLALLEDELILRRQWIRREEFADMAAISESTPGPVAINSATYIGYRIGGVPGAIVATLGVCIPSFVIIFLISLFFDAFLSLKIVGYAFRGVQVGVIYLIASAGLRMLKASEKTPLAWVLFLSVFLCMVLFSLLSVTFSSVFYILIAGTIAVMIFLISQLRGKERRK